MAAAEHRKVTEKFIAACARGDLDGLIEVLAPDAWGDFDGGPADHRDRGVARGAAQVARRLLTFWGPPATLVSHPVAGQPALLGFRGRELAGVLVFTMTGSTVQAVHVIADPRQLGFLLTFGNTSDWSRNVRAAGGCTIVLNGTGYRAVHPEFADRDQAAPVVRAAFGPVERAMFRMLGIRQYLLLRRADS